MRVDSVGKIILTAAILGMCVPALCYSITYVFNIPLPAWALIVWPSAIMLLAIFRPGDWHTIVPLSIFVNIILYSVVGLLLGLAVRWSRDGRG